MNVRVASFSDARRIEVLAQDLPCFGGSQLAVDVTLRSDLTRNGEAQPEAAEEDGAILLQARVDKENNNPELLNGRCRVVVALETGGRRSKAVDFIWQLAQAKARQVPILHGIGVNPPLDEDEHSVRRLSRGRWWSRSKHADVCTTEEETPSLSEGLTHDPRKFWTVIHLSLPSRTKKKLLRLREQVAMAYVGKPEQKQTSVLKFVFQH